MDTADPVNTDTIIEMAPLPVRVEPLPKPEVPASDVLMSGTEHRTPPDGCANRTLDGPEVEALLITTLEQFTLIGDRLAAIEEFLQKLVMAPASAPPPPSSWCGVSNDLPRPTGSYPLLFNFS